MQQRLHCTLNAVDIIYLCPLRTRPTKVVLAPATKSNRIGRVKRVSGHSILFYFIYNLSLVFMGPKIAKLNRTLCSLPFSCAFVRSFVRLKSQTHTTQTCAKLSPLVHQQSDASQTEQRYRYVRCRIHPIIHWMRSCDLRGRSSV